MPLPLSELTQAAFDGMRDSLSPQTGQTRKAKLLQNVYPVDPQFGGGLTGRPGMQVTQQSQLGTAGHRNVQRVYQYTKQNGTETTIAICGGLLYTYDWITATWTNVPLVGVGLPQDTRVFCTTFNDKLVVNPNDGVNLPWTWDGTTFVSLTNAPLAYGPLTVYYAKLFLIKYAQRNVIDWSEENDPTTGYESGGFNNSWALTQTAQEALTAILGTNEELYYWRARATGKITGAVNSDFVNSGTHDSVSLKSGTISPAAITTHETTIFFLDADGRPQVIPPGGSAVPIWQDYRNTLLNVPRTTLSDAVATTYTPIPLVLMAVTELNQLLPNLVLTISPTGDEPPAAGVWRGWTLLAMDMVKDSNGTPTLVFGGNDGYLYQVGDPNGTIWDDALVSGTVGVQHIVQPSYLGWHPKNTKAYDRVRVNLSAPTNVTGIVLDYQTPDVTETLAAQNATVGTISLWDQAIWDQSVWSSVSAEAAVEWGIQGSGRWFLGRLTHQQVGERFGLDAWEVDAYETGASVVLT